MAGYIAKSSTGSSCWLYDCLFMCCAALFAFLVWRGIMVISASGTFLDSDLMTYAQGMAGAAQPERFELDPVLHHASPSNSIPNLQRLCATWLAPNGDWAVGLLRAGSIAIFLFYANWYILGRWLYGRPALAALLSICCGITVWVGWGTFWGVTHSDPVPRVFFGALLPILLGLAAVGLRHPAFRPFAMLGAGLCMWVHGVSALNAGAMLFVAFLFNPCHKFYKHILNLILCLVVFFIPVGLFLWPTLASRPAFTTAELDVFRDVFALRWAEDYSNFWPRFMRFFSPSGPVLPILLGGLAGFLITLFAGTQREKLYCRMYPCFIMALLAVTLFCWAESHYASQFDHLPMGHELVRGMRFLIPVSWLFMVAGISCIPGKWLTRVLLCVVVLAICIYCQDRQFMAAEYAITRYTGLRLPLTAKAEVEKAQADNFAEVLNKIRQLVPEGDQIYSPEEVMQLRYKITRPLAHTFKDGYVHYYNKDIDGARDWLELEELKRGGEEGWRMAWETSGAPWLLIPAAQWPGALPNARVILDMNGWILAKKND